MSVMMTFRAMNMTVCDLFLGSIAHIDHGHIEVQVDAGKRMIAIDHNMLLGNFAHGNDQHFTIGPLGVKLATDSDRGDIFEHGLGYLLQHGVITRTIAFFRGNSNRHDIADRLSGKRAFQAGNDITGTV